MNWGREVSPELYPEVLKYIRPTIMGRRKKLEVRKSLRDIRKD